MNYPKTLVIDIGNSQIKFCLVRSDFFNQNSEFQILDELKKYHRINHLNHQFLMEFSNLINSETIDRVLICTVKSNQEKGQLLLDFLQQRAKKQKKELEIYQAKSQKEIIFNFQNEKIKLINGYKNYEQLGKDRWLAMVSGLFLSLNSGVDQRAKKLSVIDFGTVISIDFIEKIQPEETQNFKFIGGMLLANFELAQQSLSSKMPLKLENQAQKEQPLLSGQDTNQCIEAGFFNSIELLLNNHPQIIQSEKIYLTGGLLNSSGFQFLPKKSNQFSIQHSLVLFGLCLQALNEV